MSEIYITSDTHFSHSTMIQKSWRPFKSVTEMNQVIIDNWNNTVSDDDTVYFLGDFAFSKDKEVILSQLRGNIIMVKGNHDKLSLTRKRNIILTFKGYLIELVHRPEDVVAEADIVIHGHIHKAGQQQYNLPAHYYNANCEFHKYKPKALREIIGEVTKQK